MVDLILSVALWSTLLVAFAIGVSLVKLAQVNWGWLALSVVVFAIYTLVLKTDFNFLTTAGFSDAALKLNIDGKLAGTVIALLSIVLVLSFCGRLLTAQSIGLTLRQADRSFVPAMAVTLGFIVLAAVVDKLIGKSGTPILDPFTLIYPLVAGLDEELIYRGLLMALLCLALPSKGVVLCGARISIGGLLALVLFSIIHGIKIKNGLPSISPPGMVLTLVYGGVFLWLREKTGSLLMPVVAHNLGNTVAWLL